ncbi:uncharacterized protein LOC124285611 [Haliotis rubra]|uniref:uncharacterized protein LOC124285611 n=1 Tax=Haliotis rubra TaxID=36100 RepID=UPI001EE59836|nr:uncharacterized protein LOC124285611 [Haliotis rubra]
MSQATPKRTRLTDMAPAQGLATGAEMDTDPPDSDSGEQSDDPSMQDRKNRQLSSRTGRGRAYITGVSGGTVKNSTVIGSVIDSSVNVHNPKSVYIKNQAPSLAMQVSVRNRNEEFLSIWTNGMIKTKATEILIDNKIGKGAGCIT